MSQEIREKALSAAVQVLGQSAGIAGVIAAAKQLEAYIASGASAAPKETPKAAEPKSAAKVEPKAAPATKPAAKPEAKPEKAKALDPDAKKLVGDKVNELLKANKRDEAVALLASFDGAASATGIVVQGDEVIQAFLAGAEEILASSEGGLAN